MGGSYAPTNIARAFRLASVRKHRTHGSCSVKAQLSRAGSSRSFTDHQSCVVVGELEGIRTMVLIAQIALGVVIGGLTIGLLAIGLIMWVQDRKKGKERLAVELLVAGAVIVAVLIAITAMQ